MKTKNIILIIVLGIIAFNTLIGGVMDAYKMPNCLLVDLSMILTGSLLYFLIIGNIVDGFKIGMTSVYCFSGIIRAVCMGAMGTNLHNNLLFLSAIFILLLEIIGLFVVSYLSKK